MSSPLSSVTQIAGWGSTPSHSVACRRLKAVPESWHLAAQPGTSLEEWACFFKAWAQCYNHCSCWHLLLGTFSVIVMATIILAAVECWWRSKLTNSRILKWQLTTLWRWERESRRPAAISSFSTREACVPCHRSDSHVISSILDWLFAGMHSTPASSSHKKYVWVEANWSEATMSTPCWFFHAQNIGSHYMPPQLCLVSCLKYWLSSGHLLGTLQMPSGSLVSMEML